MTLRASARSAAIVSLSALALVMSFHAARPGVSNGFITGQPLGFCALSSLAAATGFAACAGGHAPTGSLCVFITATGNNINWRDDADPTATPGTGGQLIATGASMWYCGKLSTIKFIQQASGGIISASFYK